MVDAQARIAFDPLSTGGRTRRLTSRTIVYLLLGLFSLYYMAPLVILFMNSMRPLDDIVRGGFIDTPQSLSLRYWKEAWGTFCIAGTCEGVSRFFMNSLLMAIPATVISTALGLVNGYVLSKWRFRGSDLMFGLITLGVFLPGALGLQIDASQPKAVPFERCIPDGCVVRAPIAAAMLAQMRAGTTAHLIVSPSPQERVKLPISLNGFTAAFNSL